MQQILQRFHVFRGIVHKKPTGCYFESQFYKYYSRLAFVPNAFKAYICPTAELLNENVKRLQFLQEIFQDHRLVYDAVIGDKIVYNGRTNIFRMRLRKSAFTTSSCVSWCRLPSVCVSGCFCWRYIKSLFWSSVGLPLLSRSVQYTGSFKNHKTETSSTLPTASERAPSS